jgi:hypothetical protein
MDCRFIITADDKVTVSQQMWCSVSRTGWYYTAGGCVVDRARECSFAVYWLIADCRLQIAVLLSLLPWCESSIL